MPGKGGRAQTLCWAMKAGRVSDQKVSLGKKTKGCAAAIIPHICAAIFGDLLT